MEKLNLDYNPAATKPKPSVLKEFGQSFANGAILNPVDAVNQLINKTAGTNLDDHLAYNLPQAKFNTASWYVQTVGSSLGALLPLIVTSKLFSTDANATLAAPTSDLSFMTKTGSAGLSIKESALTGLTYGGLLTPSNNRNENLSSFLKARVENGLSSSLMFSTMTAGSIGLSKLAQSPLLNDNIFGAVLNKNITNSILASLPASLLSTETTSLLNQHKLATSSQLWQEAYSMSLISAGLAAANDISMIKSDSVNSLSGNNFSSRQNAENTNPNPDISHLIKDNTGNLALYPIDKAEIIAIDPDKPVSTKDTSIDQAKVVSETAKSIDKNETVDQAKPDSVPAKPADQAQAISEPAKLDSTTAKPADQAQVEIQLANGYKTLIKADLSHEKNNFEVNAKAQIPDTARSNRLLKLGQDFIDSNLNSSVGPNEKAITLHYLNQLMAEKPDSTLPANLRIKLVEQILYNASRPEAVDQGQSTTCLTANVEKRLYTRAPQAVAKILSEVGLTGKLTNIDGKVIDISHTNIMEPDGGAKNILEKAFNPKFDDDIKVDNFRNFASQILQGALVNLYYSKFLQNLDYLDIQPDETVQFIKVKPDPSIPYDTAERIVAYKNGTSEYRVLSKVSNLYPQNAIDVYNLAAPALDSTNNIAMGHDKGFVVLGQKSQPFVSELVKSGDVKVVESLDNFIEVLKQSKQDNIFPLILNVEPNLDTQIFGPRTAENYSHAIMLHDASEDNGQLKVELSNQWGRRYNFMGDKAVPVSQVFKFLV